jgi:hypothetical protein
MHLQALLLKCEYLAAVPNKPNLGLMCRQHRKCMRQTRKFGDQCAEPLQRAPKVRFGRLTQPNAPNQNHQIEETNPILDSGILMFPAMITLKIMRIPL